MYYKIHKTSFQVKNTEISNLKLTAAAKEPIANKWNCQVSRLQILHGLRSCGQEVTELQK